MFMVDVLLRGLEGPACHCLFSLLDLYFCTARQGCSFALVLVSTHAHIVFIIEMTNTSAFHSVCFYSVPADVESEKPKPNTEAGEGTAEQRKHVVIMQKICQSPDDTKHN